MTSDPTAAGASGPAEDPPAAELPRGWRAVGKGAETVQVADEPEDSGAITFAGDRADDAPVATEPDDDDDLSISNAGLLGIGVLAGVYLLYTIGWFIGADRISFWGEVLLSGGVEGLGAPVFTVLRWAAIAAPFVWFVVTFILTRHSRPWKRFAVLVAGALLLIPWPLLVPFATNGVTP